MFRLKAAKDNYFSQIILKAAITKSLSTNSHSYAKNSLSSHYCINSSSMLHLINLRTVFVKNTSYFLQGCNCIDAIGLRAVQACQRLFLGGCAHLKSKSLLTAH